MDLLEVLPEGLIDRIEERFVHPNEAVIAFLAWQGLLLYEAINNPKREAFQSFIAALQGIRRHVDEEIIEGSHGHGGRMLDDDDALNAEMDAWMESHGS